MENDREQYVEKLVNDALANVPDLGCSDGVCPLPGEPKPELDAIYYDPEEDVLIADSYGFTPDDRSGWRFVCRESELPDRYLWRPFDAATLKFGDVAVEPAVDNVITFIYGIDGEPIPNAEWRALADRKWPRNEV
jgi:hypothetical protein